MNTSEATPRASKSRTSSLNSQTKVFNFVDNNPSTTLGNYINCKPILEINANYQQKKSEIRKKAISKKILSVRKKGKKRGRKPKSIAV